MSHNTTSRTSQGRFTRGFFPRPCEYSRPSSSTYSISTVRSPFTCSVLHTPVHSTRLAARSTNRPCKDFQRRWIARKKVPPYVWLPGGEGQVTLCLISRRRGERKFWYENTGILTRRGVGAYFSPPNGTRCGTTSSGGVRDRSHFRRSYPP
jgi:hypothetical protein